MERFEVCCTYIRHWQIGMYNLNSKFFFRIITHKLLALQLSLKTVTILRAVAIPSCDTYFSTRIADTLRLNLCRCANYNQRKTGNSLYKRFKNYNFTTSRLFFYQLRLSTTRMGSAVCLIDLKHHLK